jgi:hypothetical protein
VVGSVEFASIIARVVGKVPDMDRNQENDDLMLATHLRSDALEFLRSEDRDGLWAPQVGAIPNAMTTAEVLAAAGAELHPDPSRLNRAFSRLLALQREDGSWTDPNDQDPWDCSATAWSIWALRTHTEAFDARRRGLAFLEGCIRDDGGVSTNARAKVGNTYASAYALRCFVESGLSNAADKVFQFIRRVQNGDGGWGLFEGAPSEPTLTMYVLDGLLSAPLPAPIVSRGIGWLLGVRGRDGTFGSWLEAGTSVEGTAFGLYVLRKAKIRDQRQDRSALIFVRDRLKAGDGYSIKNCPQIWIGVSVYLAGKGA